MYTESCQEMIRNVAVEAVTIGNTPLFKCSRCGGYYTSLKQASRVGVNDGARPMRNSTTFQGRPFITIFSATSHLHKRIALCAGCGVYCSICCSSEQCCLSSLVVAGKPE